MEEKTGFRPMRRKNQQLPAEECERILREEPRGVLAVLGDGGYPYTVPLDFVYEDGKLYFHCATAGHKLDALKNGGRASFCVLDKGEKPEDDWAYYFRSVIVFGRLRLLEDREEILRRVRSLGLKYNPDEDWVDNEMRKYGASVACLELTIEHMTGKRVHER